MASSHHLAWQSFCFYFCHDQWPYIASPPLLLSSSSSSASPHLKSLPMWCLKTGTPSRRQSTATNSASTRTRRLLTLDRPIFSSSTIPVVPSTPYHSPRLDPKFQRVMKRLSDNGNRYLDGESGSARFKKPRSFIVSLKGIPRVREIGEAIG
ncbi:hypothetical protein ACFX13_000452 [Malus domestica]